MTQLSLSRKTRINVTRISFIENGLVQPSDVERSRIARAFSVEPTAVFPESEAVA